MRRWLFVPLDDRPITSGFPTRLAPLGGLVLTAPPRGLLGRFLTPGTAEELPAWLDQNAAGCEGAIVNLDMLAYGGLIASRSPSVTAEAALARVESLQTLKRRGLRVLATSVIMRLGITGSSPEAVRHHELVRRWSIAAAEDPAAAADLERQIPSRLLEKYRRVRERNHAINRQAVVLVADGSIDFLLLLQEDSAPQGLHRTEQRALEDLVRRHGVEDRVLLSPGTDEGALTLLARAALDDHQPPLIQPVFSHAATAELPAPYEDRPYRETLELQVRAAGATLGALGIALLVNTPTRYYGDHLDTWNGLDDPAGLVEVTDGAEHLIRTLKAQLERGVPTAVADVAFANGADPVFTSRWLEAVDWTRLHGYAAWNTAANTTGTAVAMAVLCHLNAGRNERLRLEALLTRILDDYGYQARVRPEVIRWVRGRGGNPFNLGEFHGEASVRADALMSGVAREIHQHGPAKLGYALRRFEARLPWPRLFEVDVSVELIAP